MADLRTLKDRAADLAARGKLDRAEATYREVLAQAPRDVASRQRLAEVLRRAGRPGDAVAVFREVAERFAHDGLLPKAIAICKIILELDPAHGDTQAMLAELYGRRGEVPPARTRMTMMAIPAVAAPVPAASPPAPAPAPEGAPAPRPRADVAAAVRPATAALGDPATPLAEILIASGVEAGIADDDVVIELGPDEELSAGSFDELEVVADEPPPPGALQAPRPPPAAAAPPPTHRALPRVPIFSDLGRDAFVALTREMALHRVAAGAAVLRQGEGGTSFYVVATGRLAVSRRDERGEEVVLAHLGENDFFGEMALLSGAPRSATVTAEAPCELLEFRAETLRALAGRHPQVAGSLRRFYRQRLLANAMAVSPAFRPLPRGDRKLVMERFRAREVAAGEVVIREGEPSDGLYVVLDGEVEVVKRRGPETVGVGRLGPGDLFGEMSCLRKAPATATVVARRAGTLLRLPRPAFDEVVTAYPQILELVAGLSEERAESLDAILSGRAEWTEDGLVLV